MFQRIVHLHNLTSLRIARNSPNNNLFYHDKMKLRNWQYRRDKDKNKNEQKANG